MFVKICGITRVEDARLAVELGASAIGMVFWSRSRRAVTVDAARAIARAVAPRVACVGVFVNEDADVVNRTAGELGLQAVQLHGDEPAAYCRRMRVPVIKAVSVKGDGTAAAAALVPSECTVLLDTFDATARGGTGITSDWDTAAAVARERPVILAGGLHAGNVSQAIDQVSPFGVDVSSGVEAAPGIKDPERLRAFLEAVRAIGSHVS